MHCSFSDAVSGKVGRGEGKKMGRGEKGKEEAGKGGGGGSDEQGRQRG